MTERPSSRGKVAAFRDHLRYLYLGQSRAQRFRYGLLFFDAVTIAFIVGTSFLSRTVWLEWLDIIFGLIILADFSARLSMSVRPIKEFAHPATWADMVAIVSFLAPVAGKGLGFLRIREHSGFSIRISSQRFSELTVISSSQ